MMNLDLEHPQIFWPLIKEEAICESVLSLCRREPNFVSSIGAYGDLPQELDSALRNFVENARARILSVSAYHGCRVIHECDYRNRGVKRLETNRIIEWCKSIFGRDYEIDQIIRELGDGYLRHGESGVYCMRGIDAAIRNGCQHPFGSELIRIIASRLGAEEEEKYLRTGTPCFIEVRAPIDWFNWHSRMTVDPLLRNLYSHWLWSELSLDWPGDPRVGGIVFYHDIPSDMIFHFHYLEDTQQVGGAKGDSRPRQSSC